MAQKYKIFIKDFVVELREDPMNSLPNTGLINNVMGQIKKGEIASNVQLYVPSCNDFLTQIKSSMVHIVAGGGVVFNTDGELLMIFRRGCWDLPKGKLESGESIEACAMREVEEECGVSGLKLLGGQHTTFHVYVDKGVSVLKESVWFSMSSDWSGGSLTPQIEEEISKVAWVKLPVSSEIMNTTFPSIWEVIDHLVTEE